MRARKILVVEDDPTLQYTMKAILTKLGYHALVVGSGEDAISCSGDDLTMIFMDVGLPGMQGDDATVAIRQKEAAESRPRVPIVGLTGHATRQTCLNAGMDDYIQKPAMIKDLQSMIDKVLAVNNDVN